MDGGNGEGKPMFDWQQAWQKINFTRKQQQAFLEDFHSLIQDGVLVHQAIETIANASTGINQQVAHAILDKMSQGQSLANSMQPWFEMTSIEIIRAGEETGTLTQTTASAMDALRQNNNAIGNMISSLLYPIVVFSAAAAMIVFIKTSVLLSFSEIKPVREWPSVGQTLFHLAYFIENWWWLTLAILVCLSMLIFKSLQYLTGSLRNLIDRLPLLSLYRENIAANFMETLGLLLKNGVVLKRALMIIHQQAKPYLAWHLDLMEVRLCGGKENIADLIDTNLITPNDLARLKIVGQSKGFADALIKLGDRANTQHAKAIDRLGKILGGLLLLASGTIAATMVFGIYTVGNSIAT